jgi:hypothetical protein
MARGTPDVDAAPQNHREIGVERGRVAAADSARRSTMDDRRARIYGRLEGLPRFAPSKTLGTAIVLLAVVIALIIAFVR